MSGRVALDAAFTYAWNELHFPEQIIQEGLETHRVLEAYLWGTEFPDTYVDISDHLELKAESLSKHVSQMSPDPVRRAEWDPAVGCPAGRGGRPNLCRGLPAHTV